MRLFEFQADRRCAEWLSADQMKMALQEYGEMGTEKTHRFRWLDMFYAHPSLSRRIAALQH